MAINEEKLNEFLGRFVTDLGATVAAGSVVVGHRLGLYRGLAEGPATAEQLARRTGTQARYVAEWLGGQAAGGYVGYDPATEQFSLTAEQAFALADPDERFELLLDIFVDGLARRAASTTWYPAPASVAPTGVVSGSGFRLKAIPIRVIRSFRQERLDCPVAPRRSSISDAR